MPNFKSRCVFLLVHHVWLEWVFVFHQVHGGGGYDSEFSDDADDDEQGGPSEKALKRLNEWFKCWAHLFMQSITNSEQAQVFVCVSYPSINPVAYI